MHNDKIIVVPDVHGRSFWREVEKYPDYRIVFLGDYMDPYPWEGITYDAALNEFKSIVEFKKSNPDRVVLLLGNHIGHYVGLSNDCARYDYRHESEIASIVIENKDLFQHAYRWKDTLFTHAGVTKKWLKFNGLKWTADTVEGELNSNIVLYSPDSYKTPAIYAKPICDIGWSRGGSCPSGSPIWADYGEDLANDEAFQDELFQIVGHSQLRDTGSTIYTKHSLCCDSRQCFIWDGKDIKALSDVSADDK